MVHNLLRLGLEHYILLADEAATCTSLAAASPLVGGCVYGSYMHTLDDGVDPKLVAAYSASASSGHNTYGLWTMRKHYMARLLELGYNVMQSDLDILWMANPYPYLKSHFKEYSLVMQTEGSVPTPRANAGLIYVHRVPTLHGVSSTAQWIFHEMEQRTKERRAHPVESLNAIFNGILGADDVNTIVYVVRQTSDEQDMLRDVVSSAFEGEYETYATMRARMTDLANDKQTEFPNEQTPANWLRSAEEKVNGYRWDTVEADKLFEEDRFCIADGPQKEKRLVVEYRHMAPAPGFGEESVGLPSEETEKAANAFPWLFGLQPQLLEMPSSCFDRPTPTSWEPLSKPLPAAIVHLPGMVSQQREFLMRSMGYWHPHPVDTHLQVFPMDNSRVLALQVPDGGLYVGLDSMDAFLTLLKRLGALAAVSGRTLVVPQLRCDSQAGTNWLAHWKKQTVFRQVCPQVEGGCCVHYPSMCKRHAMVHMVDVAWAERFLQPREIGSVDTTDLNHGGGAEDGDDGAGWDADEWVRTGMDPTTRSPVPARWVRRWLQEEEKVVLYLSLGDNATDVTVEQALEALPRDISGVNEALLSELQAYDCPPLMPRRDGGKTPREAVTLAKNGTARLLCRVDPYAEACAGAEAPYDRAADVSVLIELAGKAPPEDRPQSVEEEALDRKSVV